MGVTEGIKESMEDIVAQKTLLDKKGPLAYHIVHL